SDGRAHHQQGPPEARRPAGAAAGRATRGIAAGAGVLGLAPGTTAASPTMSVSTLAVRHRAELGLFLAVRGTLRALPLAAARSLGAALGELLWLAGVRRQTVRDNLALVFPEWPPARRRAVARGCYRHLGAMACDTIAMARLDPVAL